MAKTSKIVKNEERKALTARYREKRKALKAIVPTVSPPGHPFLNEPFYGGIMLMAASEWMFAMGRRTEQIIGLQGLYTEDSAYYEALPLAKVAEIAGVKTL